MWGKDHKIYPFRRSKHSRTKSKIIIPKYGLINNDCSSEINLSESPFGLTNSTENPIRYHCMLSTILIALISFSCRSLLYAYFFSEMDYVVNVHSPIQMEHVCVFQQAPYAISSCSTFLDTIGLAMKSFLFLYFSISFVQHIVLFDLPSHLFFSQYPVLPN